MRRGESGKYEVTSIGGERVRAFVPAPLPPQPLLVLDGSLQITREITGKRRDRLFIYAQYLSILNEGTEAL